MLVIGLVVSDIKFQSYVTATYWVEIRSNKLLAHKSVWLQKTSYTAINFLLYECDLQKPSFKELNLKEENLVKTHKQPLHASKT